MKIAQNLTQLIGNTPLVRLNHFSDRCGAEIIAKCEFFNPNSSVKDRIALNMIQTAMEAGTINQDTTLIEPTSGNTGIALASIAASLKLKLIITMPESMSIERRKVMGAFGAQLILTEASKGMQGAIDKAIELRETTPNSYIFQQFENPANPDAHRKTTALEILRDCENDLDLFVAGIGTGGTITGIGEVLKAKLPQTKIIAVEPKDSAVLSGEDPGSHKIQGIGAGFIPDILNTQIYDEVIRISDEEAFQTARDIAKKEGLLVGISAGANVAAACKIAVKYPGKRIVTLLPDTGERYLSGDLF